MPDHRPSIPVDIQRQVRQECHFGCVICGMPVFQYDHIIDYSESQTHEPENLALLCPNHHMDKTAGRLSRTRVQDARINPFNMGRNKTSKYKIEAATNVELWIGSNKAYVDDIESREHEVLWMNGQSFLTIHKQGDFFSYSANVTDELGETLIHIDHGELCVATDIWDYRYEGRTVSIRSGSGKIIFEAEIKDSSMKIVRGTFADKFGTGIHISSDGMATFTMSGLRVGQIEKISFGNNPFGAIAVIRRSCFVGTVPQGFGLVRDWGREYEQRAAELRQRMEQGEPGEYPPGLAKFIPYPWAS